MPAARRLLSDMGLWERFLAEGHAPWYANSAVWGSDEPAEQDFLADPDGCGWHLDRHRFDSWLREIAVARGASLLAPARVRALVWEDGRWTLDLDGGRCLTARLIVDAGGRRAPIARQLGAQLRTDDRLVCGWLHGKATSHNGVTYVEAVEDGWWYTAPLPERRRVLAFHTDSDLPAARMACDPVRLFAGALQVKALAGELAGFTPEPNGGFVAAAGGGVEPPCGPAWLATGDAALHFDPLSSQGLLNALFSGLAAAEAADGALANRSGWRDEYRAVLDGIERHYRQRLARLYSDERRWPESPFWRRRALR